MKRFILCFLVAAAFIISGCSNASDHPISGKYYYHYVNNKRSDGIISSYAFGRSGSCKKTFYIEINGEKKQVYEHFVWMVEGEHVIINHDNSFYWKKEVRGSELDDLIYSPTENSLTSTKDGNIYFGL